MSSRAVVIGGANMDIGGRPSRPPILHDSSPGTVTLRPGGVGRNIAHDLRLLGLEVCLITALGGDVYGASLLESCRALGLDMSRALILPERRSSTYLYVTDEAGEMELAISDMEITRCLTPAVLAPHLEAVNAAGALVLDANLEAETLTYLAENTQVPIYADPVSTAKALRLRGLLDRLAVLKPNRLEAEALTGERDPERAAQALLAQGVRRVFISLGSQGMLAAQDGQLLSLPCVPTRVVNTNGAGDAVMAALVWAGLRGMELRRSAEAALLAGAITAACEETNSPELAGLPTML